MGALAEIRTRRAVGLCLAALLAVAICALALPAGANAEPSPTEVWVSTSGDNGNPGTQASPFLTVDHALGQVAEGGTVHVEAGTYPCNISVNKTVTIAGAGSDETTLSGGDSGRVIWFESGGTSAAVTGVSITDGASDNGAGIYCDQSSPTFSDCMITGNTAISGTWGGAGGAIYCDGASPTFTRCMITGNTALKNSIFGGDGGAIYCDLSSPTFTGCTISSNSAQGDGGALDLRNSSTPTLTNCVLSSNSASSGGAIYCANSSPSISGCTITSNGSSSNGGGIYVHESSPTLKDCDVSSNGSAHGGGGIYCIDFSDPAITNCTFTSNSAGYDGGGVGVNDDSDPAITNCTFTSNSAGYDGGGIAMDDFSDPAITNSVFSGNGAGYNGGAVICDDDSDPAIVNCTIAGNEAGYDGDGIFATDGSSPTITNCIVWTDGEDLDGCSATYSDIQSGDAGEGNIAAAPSFVDAANGDYRLTAASPCVNAGTDTAVAVPASTTDMNGVTRPQQGAWDMGAYELPVFQLTYVAGPGGTISGSAIQSIPASGSGTPVTAVPNAGYRFVSWSDGVSTVVRTDTNVSADKTVTAQFLDTSYDKLGGVRFTIRSSRLSESAKRSLRGYARTIAAQGATDVRIDAYTSKIPDGGTTWKANKGLSDIRARTVRFYLAAQLKKLGSKAHLKSAGYGSSNPVRSNRTKGGRAANRRAEVWVK